MYGSFPHFGISTVSLSFSSNKYLVAFLVPVYHFLQEIPITCLLKALYLSLVPNHTIN